MAYQYGCNVIHESDGSVTCNCGGGVVNCDAETLNIMYSYLTICKDGPVVALQTTAEKSMEVTVSLLHPDNPGITQELILEKWYLVPRICTTLTPILQV